MRGVEGPDPVKKLMTLIAATAALVVATPAAAAPVAAAPKATGRGLILIPLTLNKLKNLYFGTIIPSNLSGVVTVPAEHFGGVTAFTRNPAEGLWKEGGEDPARDDIVIFEVMADWLDRSWWRGYRTELERRFEQDEIVVRACEVELL